MHHQTAAATAILLAAFSFARAQTQGVLASGPEKPDVFLAYKPNKAQGSMGPFQWFYRGPRDQYSLPDVYYKGIIGLGVEGRIGNDYYLNSSNDTRGGPRYYKVTIENGVYAVYGLSTIPTGLTNLDGTAKDNGPAAPDALKGSMQPIPDIIVKGGVLGPDAVRGAQLVYQGATGMSVSVTVAQNKTDPANFWRAVNDTAKAFLYDPATNVVQILLRGTNDPPNQWKITGPTGELKGTFRSGQ
jgi:hypothetical protein